jgi:hypothetical protein
MIVLTVVGVGRRRQLVRRLRRLAFSTSNPAVVFVLERLGKNAPEDDLVHGSYDRNDIAQVMELSIWLLLHEYSYTLKPRGGSLSAAELVAALEQYGFQPRASS